MNSMPNCFNSVHAFDAVVERSQVQLAICINFIAFIALLGVKNFSLRYVHLSPAKFISLISRIVVGDSPFCIMRLAFLLTLSHS